MIKTLQSQKIEKECLLSKDFIPREGLSAALGTMQNNLIKVITGPRRAGKSVFAIQLLKNLPFSYINFDDERLTAIENYDDFIKGIIQVYGNNKIILFDEIQNLPKWELFVNRLQRNGYHLIITGSNANLLSQELATHLTGRFLEYKVLPFSFQEFLLAKGISSINHKPDVQFHGLMLGYLEEYINRGGYPEIIVNNIEPGNYLNTLFESILFKDIVKRYNIRYAGKLSELGKYLLSNVGKEFSKQNITNALQFNSVHTVENYISYLYNVYLIHILRRFSFKYKELSRSPEKNYGLDTGMINKIRFKVSDDKGRFMENLVALHLLRKKAEFYYYRDNSGKEIDFLIMKNGKVSELIQSCYDLDEPGTKKREVTPLITCGLELKCKKLTIITWDYEKKEKHKMSSINFIPLWKWLL